MVHKESQDLKREDPWGKSSKSCFILICKIKTLIYNENLHLNTDSALSDLQK